MQVSNVGHLPSCPIPMSYMGVFDCPLDSCVGLSSMANQMILLASILNDVISSFNCSFQG